MDSKGLRRQVRNMGRFKQILSVFFKQGFDFYVRSLNLGDKLPFYKKLVPPDDKALATQPQRMRLAFEELGGSFVKLGQMLSLRPDWIPPAYCEEFAKLQDSVKPFPTEDAIARIEQELGQPLNKVFKTFDKTPLAAGSIAQVHRATLKTGEEVVVKVKRPKVDQLFDMDIDIMLTVANMLKKKMPELMFDPVAIVNEFKRGAEAELDFKIEARNMELFYQSFSHSPTIRVPRLFPQQSTENIVVMEFLRGTKLSEYAKAHSHISSRKVVLHHLIDATFHQIFVMGHFHADPHPGNILVLDHQVVGLLDFGLIGHLSESMKERVILLFISVIEGDVDGLVDSLVDIGAVETEINREVFKQDLIVRLGQFYDISLHELNLRKLATTVLGIARDYRMSLPTNVVMLMKTVVTLESIGESLYPKFNLVEFSRPTIKKLLRKEFSVEGLQKNFVKKARRVKRMMMVLPEQAYRFLTKLNKGDFKVEFEHKDLELLTYEMEKTSNKLVFGILSAASIIGGALAMNLPTSRIVLGLPIFAFIGFCMATSFGLILVFEIVRR